MKKSKFRDRDRLFENVEVVHETLQQEEQQTPVGNNANGNGGKYVTPMIKLSYKEMLGGNFCYSERNK